MRSVFAHPRSRLTGSVALLILLAGQLAGYGINYPLRWRWSNPAPHGGNVVDMAYSTPLGVQVAERGQIFTSDDLDLWLPRDSHTTDALRAVTFFSGRIVVTGENGRVLYADQPDNFLTGTLIDGATTNWLEAVTASGALLVAVGDNGVVYTSNNGVSWKKQTSGISNWLRGVAYGNSTFIAVGEQGTIISSPNGTNWTKKASGTSLDLNRIFFATNQFTIVGDGGLTLASTNAGLNWFPLVSGATNTLQDAAANTNGVLLLAGEHEVRVRQQGFWSNELAKTNGPPDWTYYCAIGRPDFFLIAGQTGMQSEGYNTNNGPYYWLSPFNSVRNWLWDVLYISGLYVTVGDFGTLMTSGNGVDWTLELPPVSVTNTTFLGIGGNTNLLVAVGDGGSLIVSPNYVTNIVYTNMPGTVITQTLSTLGVVWYDVPRPTTNDLQGVAVLGANLFVVTGGNGCVLTSVDGTNWYSRTTPTPKLLSSVAAWPGGLVAAGDDGALITSSDGLSWIGRNSGTTNWLYRVRYLNGNLLAVGQNGVMLTSTNATNWVSRSTGTTNWLNDIVFIQDTYFAIGTAGTVITSTNLSNWTNRGTITKKAMYGAATDSQQLVLVGIEGAIVRSQAVPYTTPVSILNYARITTNAMALNLLLLGGKADQRFALDHSTNLLNWITGPVLEIFEGDGTLFYLETVHGTNLPPQEYYRTRLVP